MMDNARSFPFLLKYPISYEAKLTKQQYPVFTIVSSPPGSSSSQILTSATHAVVALLEPGGFDSCTPDTVDWGESTTLVCGKI